MAYAAGVYDLLDLENGDGGDRACVDEGVLNSQISDVVKRYLTQFPEKRHHEAASLVLAAVQEAFPCE